MKTSVSLLLLTLGRLVLRAAAQNGSCISAPQSACTSLVGICVSKVATGQVASNNFWSAPECFAAATCAGSSTVVDAACCAGTCVSLANMNSLDYDAIYAPMVGSCAFAAGGCPVTWTDFVNYFYNTIVATNTNNFPYSGNDVLAWWSDIATWTGFCDGTLCVNGQIPYTNLDDWLHFSWATIVTTPGNQPVRESPSTDRDNNTNVWDPTPDAPCPFDDPTFCFEDNSPQQPPDATAGPVAAAVQPTLGSGRKLATLPMGLKAGITAESLTKSTTLPKYFPPNVPPPVYISNGTQQVPVALNLSGGSPPARRKFSLVDRDVALSGPTLEKRPAVRSDQCVGSIDTPNPLPILTYYCDYMPNICASIRGSGFLTNDQVILTYDPYGTGKRRNSVCTKAVQAEFRETGGCDLRQHDPVFWKVSCDEFPFNSVLEGGAPNGAIVTAVPEREQQLQATLQTALSKLLSVQNNAKTQWSKPGSLKSKFPGMCHKWMLQLIDTRPAGAGLTDVGTLFSGGAWFQKNNDEQTVTLTDHRAGPPPLPAVDPYDYPDTAAALQPTNSYKPFDCRPCTIGSVDPVPDVLVDTFINGTRAVKVDAAAASTCSRTTPTSTPTPTSDASTNAADAAAAAAAAKAALSSVNTDPATESAVQAAVEAAEAAAVAAAAAEAAAVANNPASMASTIASSIISQEALQSSIASLTNIFGIGTIPASISSIISSITQVASDTSSVIIDGWNQKPPQTDPVPPDSDPARSPTTNSAGGPNVAPAACFGAGTSGQITINGPFVWHSTGTATESATVADAGNAAYFGLNLASDGQYRLDTLCSGVYAWFNEPVAPSYQVDCSSDEFGSYWNTVKQTCYAFPQDTGYGIVCANDVGSIYSCLQSNGFQSQITAVSFTWS